MAEFKTEIAISRLLLLGVGLSAAVTFAGLLLYCARGGNMAGFSVFHPGPAEMASFAGIFGGALSGNPAAIMQAGLVLLLATPVARVLFALLAFARRRDYIYAAASALVLSMLLTGLFGG